MKLMIKKSGNSAALRIPADVMSALCMQIGDEVRVDLDDSGFTVQKITHPRDGWCDSIKPEDAKMEAALMEEEFGLTNSDGLDDLDENERYDNLW